MRLSISSSDRRFICVLALWTAALVVAANLLVAYGQHHWAWLERRLEMPNYDVPANIQDYVLNYRRCPIVVLGSSVVGALPPPGWERPDVCSITLIGLGSLLGLEIMTRTPAAPRVLFVESSFGFRDAPPAMVSNATDPLLRMLHAWFPLTTATANWINMIGKSQYVVSPDLWRPTESWAEWREKRMAYSDIYVSIYGQEVSDWGKHHLDDNLARTKATIAEMERRGTKIIFFDTPLDPRVGELPIIAFWTEKMHAAFPDHEWVTDSPEKYWLTDGMHFVSGSGEDFFKLLMAHLPDGMSAKSGS
jgi:hypothetical protein